MVLFPRLYFFQRQLQAVRKVCRGGMWGGLVAFILVMSAVPTAAFAQTNLLTEDAFTQGIEAFQAESYAAAKGHFTRAIQHNQRPATAYSNRCLTEIQLAHYPEAIADCSAAIALQPDQAQAYLHRGLAHYRLGHYQAALADYDHTLELQPHHVQARYNRGLAHVSLGHYAAALTDYDQVLQKRPDPSLPETATVYGDRGVAHLLLNHMEAAIADFDQAIDLNETEAWFYYNRACACHRQRDYGGALRDFTRVVQLSPNDPQAYLNRGLLYQELGDLQAAIADLQQAAQCFCDRGAMVAYQHTLDLIAQLQSSRSALG